MVIFEAGIWSQTFISLPCLAPCISPSYSRHTWGIWPVLPGYDGSREPGQAEVL